MRRASFFSKKAFCECEYKKKYGQYSHLLKAYFEKNEARLVKFAQVMSKFGECCTNGHCLSIPQTSKEGFKGSRLVQSLKHVLQENLFSGNFQLAWQLEFRIKHQLERLEHLKV
jgi:hypothetical protein